MTRNVYIELRGEMEISPLLFYIYYLDHRDDSVPEMLAKDFEICLAKFLSRMAVDNRVDTKKGLRYLEYNNMLDKVYKYLNEKFDTTP